MNQTVIIEQMISYFLSLRLEGYYFFKMVKELKRYYAEDNAGFYYRLV